MRTRTRSSRKRAPIIAWSLRSIYLKTGGRGRDWEDAVILTREMDWAQWVLVFMAGIRLSEQEGRLA